MSQTCVTETAGTVDEGFAERALWHSDRHVCRHVCRHVHRYAHVIEEWSGHDYIGHNCTGDDYTGHRHAYVIEEWSGHDYIGHNCIGDDYTGHRHAHVIEESFDVRLRCSGMLGTFFFLSDGGRTAKAEGAIDGSPTARPIGTGLDDGRPHLLAAIRSAQALGARRRHAPRCSKKKKCMLWDL